MEFSKCSLRECIGVLRMAAATSIVRIPTQLSRMRQVLSDFAPRNGVSPRPSILSARRFTSLREKRRGSANAA